MADKQRKTVKTTKNLHKRRVGAMLTKNMEIFLRPSEKENEQFETLKRNKV